MDHGVFGEAGDIKAEVFQKLGQAKTFIQHKRLRFLQAVILILRFGQVAASGIVAIIYGYLIYEHNTRQCRKDSRDDLYCKDANPPLEKVPLQYIGMMTAVITSFLQLFFTVLIKLEAPVISSNNCFPSARQARPRSQCDLLLLWFSDIPIFLLYLIAFNFLDKFISPTRILYGARPGTTCWSDNLSDESLPLVFRHCVLGQHGYWWSMGAMHSYFITSILFIIFSTKNEHLDRIARALRFSVQRTDDGAAEDVLVLVYDEKRNFRNSGDAKI